MTDPGVPNADAFLDALAFSRCTLRRDWEGRDAIARGCDPVQMVDALTNLFLGLIITNVGPHGTRVETYLDHMRDQLPAVLGAEQ